MAIIKKKDLNKFKASSKKEELDELVDVDGSPIEGDRNPTNDSEIETAPQQTTDDFASTAIQPNNYMRNYGGTGYTTGIRRVGESSPINTILNNILENIMDVDNNGIPDMQELSTRKPIAANKAQDFIQTISKNNLNGEEIAILLNYILTNINIDSIPQSARGILKNKI